MFIVLSKGKLISMRYNLLLCLLLSNSILSSESLAKFYEPSKANAYQGRLFYNPTTQDYPIERMRELCKQYTGVDTAQTKCFDKDNEQTTICEYKCSMHWMATE